MALSSVSLLLKGYTKFNIHRYIHEQLNDIHLGNLYFSVGGYKVG